MIWFHIPLQFLFNTCYLCDATTHTGMIAKEKHLNTGNNWVVEIYRILKYFDLNTIQPLDTLLDDIRKEKATDALFRHTSQLLTSSNTTQWTYRIVNGLLYRKNQQFVPEMSRIYVITRCHNSPAAGHFGSAKTLHLIIRSYFWPGLARMVKHYVTSCETCARNKSSLHRPYGHLQPFPVAPGAEHP